MQNRNYLILSGLIGILLYFVLPSWSKILAFLIPTLTLAYVYSNRNLNYYIIIFCSLLYLLFPSSLVTLSATTSIEVQVVKWIESPISVVMGLVIIIPMLIAVASLVISVINLLNPASWVTGSASLDSEKTIKTVLKIILVIAVVGVYSLVGGLLGWKIYGLEWVQGILVKIWDYLLTLPNTIANNDIVKDALEINTDLPTLQIAMDALTTNSRFLGLTVASIYPLILSVITIVIGIFYWITQSNPTGYKEESNQFERPLTLNLSFLFFLLLILIVAFMFYLSYSIDSFINYQNVGFFGLYLIITSVVLISLTLGIGSATKNSKMTIFGVLFGVMLLFMFQNMFSQAQTLNILNNEYANLTIVQILNNLVFIAPTESLLFHIFLPCLVIFIFLRKNGIVYSLEELNSKRSELNNEITTLTALANIRLQLNLDKDYAKTLRLIAKKQIELSKLDSQKIEGVDNTEKTLTNTQFIMYLFAVFVSNCLFAVLHWFKSGLTFEVFWTSGLGFLYLSSGMIITMIGYKYGWLSAIIVHGTHNSIILFLVQLMSVM